MTETESDRPALPGEPGIWAFIVGDLLIFSILFVTFMVYRSEDAALFIQSQHALNQSLGVLNTVLMLTSSLLVALAVGAARKGMKTAPSVLYVTAVLCGLGFGVVKIVEYGEEVRHGIGVNTNDMFMFYFVLTGLHMIHVLIGMAVLLFLAVYCRSRAGTYSPAALRNIESGSCFWHVVDLLWIVLFALLYLVR